MTAGTFSSHFCKNLASTGKSIECWPIRLKVCIPVCTGCRDVRENFQLNQSILIYFDRHKDYKKQANHVPTKNDNNWINLAEICLTNQFGGCSQIFFTSQVAFQFLVDLTLFSTRLVSSKEDFCFLIFIWSERVHPEIMDLHLEKLQVCINKTKIW